MAASIEETENMLRSQADQALQDIQTAYAQTITEFTLGGRNNSPSMYSTARSRMADVFRVKAEAMASRTIAYLKAPSVEGERLLRRCLEQLTDDVVARCHPNFYQHNNPILDHLIGPLNASFHSTIDDIVRDYKHLLPSTSPATPQITTTIGTNYGPVAVGQTVNQTINTQVNGISGTELLSLMSHLRPILEEKLGGRPQLDEAIDQVDLIELEAKKEVIEPSRIRRLGGKLLERLTDIGERALAHAFEAYLRQHGLL